MRNWYASINATPGYTTEAFDALKEKADQFYEKNGTKMLCALMDDEMAIRKHAQWNAATMKFDGFVNLGCNDRTLDPNDINQPLAKNALVFMISGIGEDFKIPIAYFLVKGLTADEKAAITNEILIRLSEIGIVVVSMTFDGFPTNFKMVKILGGSFDGHPYILDPADKNRKIYVILDVAHMLKLVRNCIGTRNLVDGDGHVISWEYFKSLYEAQKNLSWNLGNKLTKAHMEWDKKKMSVRLASETLSNSVADSMEFMQQECEQFNDVGGTVKFIRIFNDIFDIMNSTTSKNAIGFKRPISRLTAPELFSRFDTAMEYISQLKVEGETKPILFSSINTAFVGFYNNMISFKGIFNDYVQTNRIDQIICHRFSQDLLESFFGYIRSMGGKILLFLKTTAKIFNVIFG